MKLTRITALPLLATLLLVAGCGEGSTDRDGGDSRPRERAPAATPDEPAAPAEPKSPADTVALELLVGELIMTKLVGLTASEEELQAVRRLQVGGIILFGPSVRDEPQLRALLTSLDAARAPAARRAGLHPRLVVSVDQEGGPIRNIPFAPPELSQSSLADRPIEEAHAAALATGKALADLGIGVDLGPVADLEQPPNRTMIGRSFGPDPSTVAPYIRATVEGLEQGGVAATAKHFPGFGASTANSDEAVAYVDRTREQLRAEELVPFRAAIAADVDAVMVSHGIHRGLGSSRPGILDPKIVTDLLRTELGFEGVAMTDSMNARGFRESWGDTVPRACPVALAAGIDLLLLTGSIETARSCRERILDAVADGSLPEERVREAARRILELRVRVSPLEPVA